ncbi:hypothetical protein ACLOJK_000553 [Asimina triloba]
MERGWDGWDGGARKFEKTTPERQFEDPAWGAHQILGALGRARISMEGGNQRKDKRKIDKEGKIAMRTRSCMSVLHKGQKARPAENRSQPPVAHIFDSPIPMF